MNDKDRLIQLIGAIRAYEHGGMATITDEAIASYLLDNGVIAPPVKIGDKVYYICEELPEYGGCYITELTVTEVSDVRFWVEHEDDNHFRYDSIGEAVYLSRAEAERVLKECK